MYEVNDNFGRLIDKQDNFERYVRDERSELRISHVIKCRIITPRKGALRGFHCGGGGEEEFDPEAMYNVC
jgi:hypothetical protein